MDPTASSNQHGEASNQHGEASTQHGEASGKEQPVKPVAEPVVEDKSGNDAQVRRKTGCTYF